MGNRKNIKIAIILHIFYYEYVDELLQAVSNFEDIDREIFITIPESLIHYKNVLKRKFQCKNLFVVNNVGYDIYPFIKVVDTLNLDEYDYICKLHTKRDMPENVYLKGLHIPGNSWRRALLTFVSTKTNVRKTIDQFKNKDVGLVAYHQVLCDDKHDSEKKLYPTIKNTMRKLCLPDVQEKKFVAGTMFAVRASLLKYLQSQFKEDDFGEPDIEHNKQDFAHVMERCLGFAVLAQGYKIVSFDKKDADLEYLKSKMKSVLFCKKYTTHHIIIRIFGIPIFYKKR